MKSPIQAAPVLRINISGAQTSTKQSGCCVKVAGICIASSPIC